jgi:short-subunit dehydrogenase
MSKVILITGASSGLGKAMAVRLTARGHKVYGTSRNTGEHGDFPFPLKALDVTKTSSVDSAVDDIIRTEGRIDVLINNAGMGIAGPLETTTMDEARKIFETNFFGPVYLVKQVIPYMRKQGKGFIINISSLGGLFALPYQGHYSATKYAIEGYSEALRYELKGSGIDVSLIRPGDYSTGFTSARQLSNQAKEDKAFMRTLAIIEKDETSGANPDKLARLVEKIIDKKKPCPGYLSGKPDQKLAAKLKNILPSGLFYSIIGDHYKIGKKV